MKESSVGSDHKAVSDTYLTMIRTGRKGNNQRIIRILHWKNGIVSKKKKHSTMTRSCHFTEEPKLAKVRVTNKQGAKQTQMLDNKKKKVKCSCQLFSR